MSDVTITSSPDRPHRQTTPSFLLIMGLAVITGSLTQDGWPGSALALVPALLLFASQPRLRNLTRESMGLLVLSIGSIAAIAIEPGPLNLMLGWLVITLLTLSFQGARIDDLSRALTELLPRTFLSPVTAATEFVSASRTAQDRVQRRNWRGLVLPVMSALCFALLLALANPIMEQIFSAFPMDALPQMFTLLSLLVSVLVFPLLWLALRIAPLKPAPATPLSTAPYWHDAYFAPATVAVTLVILNALFFMQNGLDAAYLWSGAALPPGVTYAAYAQRGAASLIVTILLAALLILLALRPRSRTERSGVVNLLVHLWLLQNAFLLASTVMRTLAYIETYGMTELRLASLVWMALIAAGLLLVAMRVAKRRSNKWLINTNLVTALLVLWTSGFCDGRAIVADYNVDRTRKGYSVDTGYLDSLGYSALPALKHICITGNQSFKIAALILQLDAEQQNWRRWTIRKALIRSEIRQPPLPLTVESGKLLPCQGARPTEMNSSRSRE